MPIPCVLLPYFTEPKDDLNQTVWWKGTNNCCFRNAEQDPYLKNLGEYLLAIISCLLLYSLSTYIREKLIRYFFYLLSFLNKKEKLRPLS